MCFKCTIHTRLSLNKLWFFAKEDSFKRSLSIFDAYFMYENSFKKRNKSGKEYMHIILSCSTFVKDNYKMLRHFKII